MTAIRSRVSLASLSAAALALAFGAAAGPVVADEAKPSEPAKPAESAPKAADASAAKAPDFKVKDLDGKERTLAEFKDKWIVLEWANYGCPYVKKHYDPGHMQKLQKTYTDKGVVWLTVCSTEAKHKDYLDAAAFKKAVAEKKAVPTAVLLDTDGAMGKAYGARKTPDMRVISPKGVIVYSGAIDANVDQRADPAKTQNYVVDVLDAVLADKPCPIAKTEPYGCSVKSAR
jgi:peroxiredoxin